MRNNYKRNDRQGKTLMQRPPIDRVDPPHDDERRRRTWTGRLHAGKEQPNVAGQGQPHIRPRPHPH